MILLELTVEEATWLQNYVQNPIAVDEDERDANMRRALFDALATTNPNTPHPHPPDDWEDRPPIHSED